MLFHKIDTRSFWGCQSKRTRHAYALTKTDSLFLVIKSMRFIIACRDTLENLTFPIQKISILNIKGYFVSFTIGFTSIFTKQKQHSISSTTEEPTEKSRNFQNDRSSTFYNKAEAKCNNPDLWRNLSIDKSDEKWRSVFCNR